MELQEIRELPGGMYGGENKPIVDGNYDKSLAVKCVNGTFVGKKTENIISYKGIPFVSQQPVEQCLLADQYKAVLPLLGYYQFMDKFFTPHYLLDIIAAREQD